MEPAPTPDPARPLRPALVVASAGFVAALAIQLLAVFVAHGGAWTGPFLIADHRAAAGDWPIEVTPSPVGTGYDGQFYLQLALDPARRGIADEPPLPRLRVRRMLVPALVWVTALGQPGGVVAAYYLWCALFVGLGAGALADVAVGGGRSRWWGLLFALQLGTVISLWRMLLDGAAAALILATAAAIGRGRGRLAVALLAACLLTRETALVFFVAVFAAYWLHGRRKAALGSVLALVPMGLWWTWVHATIPPSPVSKLPSNFGWSYEVWAYTVKQALGPWTGTLAATKELSALALALGGIALGLSWGIVALRHRHRLSAGVLAASLGLATFAALGAILGRAVWAQAWAYARVLLPLTALAAFVGLGDGGLRRSRRLVLGLAIAAAVAGGIFLVFLLRGSII